VKITVRIKAEVLRRARREAVRRRSTLQEMVRQFLRDVVATGDPASVIARAAKTK
jgi:hypothetical protein